MASLTLEKLGKTFGKLRAVGDVDLAIADGEIIGLLGSSGCGKTSTLRMIAGFERISEGTVRIGDRPVNLLPVAARNVAMAFEGYSLYPPLTVAENIAFGLKRRFAKAEVGRKVAEIARLLEIGDILEHYPSAISGGQQQRVSLARALVRQADVYLLDEPMSQLEPQLRAVLRVRIKDWLRRHRMTTVFVTHDQTEAIALADRIAVMDQGALQQFGTSADLLDRPVNLFVAGFVGEPPMNLIEAEVLRRDGRLALAALDRDGRTAFELMLPSAPAGKTIERMLEAGRRITIGFRPQSASLAVDDRRQGAGAPASLTIRGRVVSNEWLGDQSHVGIEAGGLFLIAVTDGRIALAEDGAVTLALRPEALHAFDRETGRALIHGGSIAEAARHAA
ncbi:MAG TPA: ABC transporter ATP-binding protein [Stellaceae bacterium]|nr:ABC transporter ATP-binding protein [Stellaceae bacterium]